MESDFPSEDLNLEAKLRRGCCYCLSHMIGYSLKLLHERVVNKLSKLLAGYDGDGGHAQRDEGLHPPQPPPVLLELLDGLLRVDVAVASRDFKASCLGHLRG